ncbi:MAG TPA: hypothetical protein VF158_02595 [Longimicrobiales bacterium]
MRDQREILLVSASAGTGHVRAAEALRVAFEQGLPGVRIEHADVLDLAPGWVRRACGDGFGLVAARAPWLWRQLYERTDRPGTNEARWGGAAQHLLFRAFRRLLRSAAWDVCVCTHFLPCQVAAGRAGLPPFAVVVTDFVLHHFWVQPGVRRYFVATEEMAEQLRRRTGGARVDATGIPVGAEFAAAPSTVRARAALALDADRPVALVMGGGLGIGIEDSVDAALAADVPGLQVVAICGRNGAARDRLAARGLPPGRLRVHGYVTDVPTFLAAADVVVTKPGGLTTSETLAVGRPLLLTRPIPGQEEGNTRALVGAGAAVAAPTPETLRRALERAFREPGALERLAAGAARVGRPHAAKSIVSAVAREYIAGRAA